MSRCARTAESDAPTRYSSTPRSIRRETGAHRVVGVHRREYEVPGQTRLDRDLGGLGIPDLTDHDDVGVLPEDVP